MRPRTHFPLKTIWATTGLAIVLTATSGALFAQGIESNLLKARSIAESQHEIVMLLLQKRDFARAATEATKIFQMNWPPDQEPILLKELLFVADQFLHRGEAAHGLRFIDASAKSFRNRSSQISIWKEKGYLYKHMNQMEKALECFREARRLEQ
jgi:tetratricopeptide (TPR) repeat protein